LNLLAISQSIEDKIQEASARVVTIPVPTSLQFLNVGRYILVEKLVAIAMKRWLQFSSHHKSIQIGPGAGKQEYDLLRLQ
jgi:hypothetical protein